MAYYGEHQPIQIVESHNHKFTLQNLYSVEQILKSPELRDRNIIVVSIAGALRKGKSFLLNFFLKYLNAQYKTHNVTDWIGRNNKNASLSGFQWRGGKERQTVGIWMWSEVFTHDKSNGEKVAIILMDTQGIFDNKSSLKECISIFAISTLLSSVQCFNVMRQVQENDLNNLQLFTEYARFAMQEISEKPFQTLLFIVRDWPSPGDHEFGPSTDYVNDFLSTNERQTTKMHELRHAIRNSFKEIDAFLMPYPGREVDQQRNTFQGEINQIDEDFVDCVETLAEQLFAPQNLIAKKIAGQAVRGADFVEYLKNLVNLFSGAELPNPVTILEGTADAHLKILYEKCVTKYLDEMFEAFRNVNTYCSDDELRAKHLRATEKAMKLFREMPKLGGLALQCDYMKMLERKIKEKYETYAQKNTQERENAISVRNTFVGGLSSVAAIAGGIGSYFIGGPSGLRLFGTALASAVGGGSIGAAINAFLPSHWVNSESIVGRSIRFVTSGLENLLQGPRNRAVSNGTRSRNAPRNGTATSANSTNTNDESIWSRLWNDVRPTVMNAITPILNYRFRRN